MTWRTCQFAPVESFSPSQEAGFHEPQVLPPKEMSGQLDLGSCILCGGWLPGPVDWLGNKIMLEASPVEKLDKASMCPQLI